MYAQAFDQAGALDKLEAFASLNGPGFYNLPVNRGSITLKRESWTLPAELPFADSVLVPLNGGETMDWKLTSVQA
jgi:dihydroorotase